MPYSFQVKSNAVRALGNFLRYTRTSSLGKEQKDTVVELAAWNWPVYVCRATRFSAFISIVETVVLSCSTEFASKGSSNVVSWNKLKLGWLCFRYMNENLN